LAAITGGWSSTQVETKRVGGPTCQASDSWPGCCRAVSTFAM
jgi:hypothetical protein